MINNMPGYIQYDVGGVRCYMLGYSMTLYVTLCSDTFCGNLIVLV